MPDWAAECCRARLTRWEESLRKDLEERALRGKGGRGGAMCPR